MDIVRSGERPAERVLLEGRLRETPLVTSEAGWELVLVSAAAGTELLPVPMPREELGLVIAGRVRLTALPPDYDPSEIDLDTAGVVLGPGDAFRFSQGERVMIEVLEELTFAYARPTPPATAGPEGYCT